jgi:hypothetical protein
MLEIMFSAKSHVNVLFLISKIVFVYGLSAVYKKGIILIRTMSLVHIIQGAGSSVVILLHQNQFLHFHNTIFQSQ